MYSRAAPDRFPPRGYFDSHCDDGHHATSAGHCDAPPQCDPGSKMDCSEMLDLDWTSVRQKVGVCSPSKAAALLTKGCDDQTPGMVA
jgi:hypothetical protein